MLLPAHPTMPLLNTVNPIKSSLLIAPDVLVSVEALVDVALLGALSFVLEVLESLVEVALLVLLAFVSLVVVSALVIRAPPLVLEPLAQCTDCLYRMSQLAHLHLPTHWQLAKFNVVTK